jgi:hypothetical protein
MIPLTAAEDEARRLESVTWDPIRHQLQWVVSKGKMEGKDFKSATKEQYAINIDDATMSFSDETRRFSKREAESVRRLLDFLSRYTAESTIWWEKGMGEVVRKGLRVAAPAPPAEPLGGTGAPAPARAPGFAAKPAPEAPGK